MLILSWLPGHVGIKRNQKASTLAKEATNIRLSYTDYKNKVTQYVKRKWRAITVQISVDSQTGNCANQS